jgi:hypothetical protein
MGGVDVNKDARQTNKNKKKYTTKTDLFLWEKENKKDMLAV